MADPASPEWLAELSTRVGGAVVGEAGGARLRLGVRITGTPVGTLEYTIALGAGEPGELSTSPDAVRDVVLVEDYETSRRLAAGAPIGAELAAGTVKVEGSVGRLVAAEPELSALAALLAEPR